MGNLSLSDSVFFQTPELSHLGIEEFDSFKVLKVKLKEMASYTILATLAEDLGTVVRTNITI